ncbi:hypothetical protein J6590_041678 [Homalodisca vitripennis]|nr:hypothetical protein J6590_041678 [Homalodisca vitripennis]
MEVCIVTRSDTLLEVAVDQDVGVDSGYICVVMGFNSGDPGMADPIFTKSDPLLAVAGFNRCDTGMAVPIFTKSDPLLAVAGDQDAGADSDCGV